MVILPKYFVVFNLLTRSAMSMCLSGNAQLRIFDEISLRLKWVMYSFSFARSSPRTVASCKYGVP